MPKTLEGVSTATFKNTTIVPQPGESRKAADIEVPVRDLLNNAAILLRLVTELTASLAGHSHAIATDTTAGFMAPADRQRLLDLASAIQNHSHTLATTTVAGFMSGPDKKKLNEIEANAQVVTRERVLESLGIKTARRTLPESSFSAGQIKEYTINIQGMTPDDVILSSQYMANSGQLAIFYHAIDNAIQIFVKNLSSSSKDFTPGEITVMVLKF